MGARKMLSNQCSTLTIRVMDGTKRKKHSKRLVEGGSDGLSDAAAQQPPHGTGLRQKAKHDTSADAVAVPGTAPVTSPVWAIILQRISPDRVKVLLPLDSYPRPLTDNFEPPELANALSAIARFVAKRNLERRAKQSFRVNDVALVYDNNPTDLALDGMTEPNVEASLLPSRRALDGITPLRGGNPTAPYFVLVEASATQHIPGFSPIVVEDPEKEERRKLAEQLVNEVNHSQVKPGGFVTVNKRALKRVFGVEPPTATGELYYRQCYSTLMEVINEIERDPENRQTSFYSVTGTPGIGKSTMLFFLLMEFLIKKQPVVVFRRENPVLYVAFHPAEDRLATVHVSTLMPSNTPTDPPRQYVYLTDTNDPGVGYNGLGIWAHSRGAFEREGKQAWKQAAAHLAIPLWTDAEVELAHSRWHVPADPNDLAENQALWGNVPRLIFRPAEYSRREMNSLLDNLRVGSEEERIAQLKLMMQRGSSTSIVDRMMLMHVPTEGEERFWAAESHRFCTTMIFERLIEATAEDIDEAQRRFIQVFAAVPGSQGAVGNVFKAYAHRRVCFKSETYRLLASAVPEAHVMHKVYTNDKGPPHQDVVLQMHPERRVFFLNVAALKSTLPRGELADNVYYQPYKRNQGAVDAFIRVSDTLYLWQYTVSPSHDVALSGLREVLALTSDSVTKVVFIFCVPEYVLAEFKMGALKKSKSDLESESKNNVTAPGQVKGNVRKVRYYKTSLPFDTFSSF